MAITFSDGVILGADSRTTTGAYIANRVTDKLTQVHDTIWCCRSGSAADTQAVADIVHYHLGMYGITNEQPPTTQTAAALFQELCYDNKDQLRWVWPRIFYLRAYQVLFLLYFLEHQKMKINLSHSGTIFSSPDPFFSPEPAWEWKRLLKKKQTDFLRLSSAPVW